MFVRPAPAGSTEQRAGLSEPGKESPREHRWRAPVAAQPLENGQLIRVWTDLLEHRNRVSRAERRVLAAAPTAPLNRTAAAKLGCWRVPPPPRLARARMRVLEHPYPLVASSSYSVCLQCPGERTRTGKRPGNTYRGSRLLRTRHGASAAIVSSLPTSCMCVASAFWGCAHCSYRPPAVVWRGAA